MRTVEYTENAHDLSPKVCLSVRPIQIQIANEFEGTREMD